MTNHSYEDDYLWDTGDSGRLDTVRSSLPEVVSSGETVVLRGEPRFKSRQTITCPSCGQVLRPGTATIVFKHAPPERKEQQVEGWICECGESYVPGAAARKLFDRAMRTVKPSRTTLDVATLSPSNATHENWQPEWETEGFSAHEERQGGRCDVAAIRATATKTDLNEQLRELLDEHAYEHWFQGKTQISTEGDRLCVTVANPYLLKWIQKRFQPVFSELATQQIGPGARLRFAVDASVVAGSEPAKPVMGSHIAADRPPDGGSHSELRSRRLSELKDFVVGECNELAFAAAQQVAADPSGQYNPLYIYGGVGIGKTHLLEGIYSRLRNERVNVLLITAESFGRRFTEALREKTFPSFRQQFRNADVLLIDDVDFFGGKREFQKEFLHTFRQFEKEGRQIIITSSCHPRLLSKTSDELISRYLAGLVCHVEPPELRMRRAIVQQRTAMLQLPIDEQAVDLIAHRFSRSVREVLGAVNCLHTWNRMTGRRVTVSAAREVLARLERDCIRIVRIADIDGAVCRLFGVTSEHLRSTARRRDLIQPRMLAMYLARHLTRAPYSEIGKYFGVRSHSTVISAEKRITRLLEEDACIRVSSEEWPLAEVVTTVQKQVLAVGA